jgi:hypothetical protein
MSEKPKKNSRIIITDGDGLESLVTFMAQKVHCSALTYKPYMLMWDDMVTHGNYKGWNYYPIESELHRKLDELDDAYTNLETEKYTLQAENERLRDAMGDTAKRLEDVHPPSGIVEDVIGALNNLKKDLS